MESLLRFGFDVYHDTVRAVPVGEAPDTTFGMWAILGGIALLIALIWLFQRHNSKTLPQTKRKK